MAGTQGPEKIVIHTQDHAYQKSGQKPLGGDYRRRHPSNRRQLKLGRGSS